MQELYIGIDIGGTKCAVLIGTGNVKVLERISFPTDLTQTPYVVMDKMISICRNFIIKYHSSGNICCVGISCGGPLDDKKGIICSPPNLPGWDNIPITEYISAALGLPVFLQNDANACAMAEWKFGAGKGSDNMVFFTFGTGLGAGLIINGRLYSGANGMAGEAGHIRLSAGGPEGYGKEGSFEGYCSGGGIKNLAILMAKETFGSQTESIIMGEASYPLNDITAKLIFEHAAAGDSFAAAVTDRCAEHLGRGLSIIIDILNPEIIVLGSIFVRGEHLLRAGMQKYIEQEALPDARQVCRILPAALGESIGDIAALTVAIYNQPLERSTYEPQK